LCLTSLTLPKVPVPNVDKNLKSLRRNFPCAFLLSLPASSSASSYWPLGLNMNPSKIINGRAIYLPYLGSHPPNDCCSFCPSMKSSAISF
jgi:hypothetical protein